MDGQTFLKNLESIVKDYVVTVHNKNNKTYDIFLYYPGANSWATQNKILDKNYFNEKDVDDELDYSVELIDAILAPDRTMQRKDFLVSELIFETWAIVFNQIQYMTISEDRYICVNTESLVDIEVWTKKESKEYVSKRNNQSEIIL